MTDASYPAGTPIWTDLISTDIDAGRRFYEQLFGWTTGEAAGPEFGGYAMFMQDGKLVAGSMPGRDGDHPAWATYVLTEDAAETARKVREAGGEVAVEPMPVGESGTMAVFRDPTGAYVGVWQAGEHKGADLFNEPVSMTWNELGTRDVEAAKRFYSAVFGWNASGDDYVQWQVGDKTVGGCIDLASVGVPDETPANWLVYFAVKNADESAARVTELGGSVMRQPMDIPGMGRFAVVSDPQGAVFAVFSS